MAISKVLLVLNLLFCKIPQSLLSHRCLAKGPGIIKCSGRVWVEPASIIQMGQNISINCHCMKKCQKGKLSLNLNNGDVEDTLLSVINQTTVQLNLQNYNEPFSTVSCLLKSSRSRLICGTQFCMGNLPDKPANLTCIKPEQLDNMICTWKPGQKTHLNTNYILYVKSLFTEENKGFVSNSSSVTIPLNQLQKNQTFSISVHAENYLGGIHSEELHVDLNTIVIPAVPVVVQNKTMESPAFKTIIHWKRQTAINETYCEERYKETISETWHVRDWDANLRNEVNTEYNLDANTKYEFQIRCKLTHPRSLWSRWSESTIYITPEKEPAAVLDVWRKFGPVYPNGTQEMTVLIKPLSPKESRGKILDYRIFYEKQGEKVDLCKTTEIHCKVMLPPAVTIIYVTAHNSKGSSKPASIMVKQLPHNYQAFPPPTHIQIFTDKQKGISVKWEPPKSIGKTLLWYIVEWVSANFNHLHHNLVAWKKVPFQNTSTSFEEGIRMGESATISVYAVYQKGISRASSIQTLMNEKKELDISQERSLVVTRDVHAFLCKAFVPACFEQTRVVHPCRSLCARVYEDCKKMIDMFEIGWPKELECSRLEDCDDTAAVTASFTTRTQDTWRISGQPKRDYGFWCPRHLQTSSGQGYRFLGIEQCAPPCPNMYFNNHELEVAKSFIGIVSIFCLCATLFTFLTFLIDVKRFRYPERPIIYYSVCYSIVSLVYFLGFVLGNTTACNKGDEKLQLGETVVLGSQNKGCTLVFMALYFFTMAGTVWWVILTVTWFLAAGRKWSCEAIEQKAMWFHAVAWGMPGFLTVMLLAMNKVEGDNISGVCFIGLYDLATSRYFVLLPLCVCVFVGLSLLLAGIISLNHVRQVIQNDGRNQEKLKKFMIRIGVFSGLYLVPLVILLGCYIYEQVYRKIWETTWVYDHCDQFHIPCPYQVKTLARPEITLFLMKYLMTLIVGISPVFWIGSKKTCSEWASFFKKNRKRDPISESRRVLQESCEFFLKHNSKAKHKKKHYKSSSHKLKVISKSMGTSTGATSNHGTSAVAIANHDYLSHEALTEIKSCMEASERDMEADVVRSQRVEEEEIPHCEQSMLQMWSSPKVPVQEQESKADNKQDIVSLSESMKRAAEERTTPKNDVTETLPVQLGHSHASVSQLGNTKGSGLLFAHSSSDSRKAHESGHSSNG